MHNTSQTIGENVKRLITMFMAKEAIPNGGGFDDD